MFMAPEIKSSVEMGSCSRLCAGEGLCKSIYKNPDSKEAFVSMTPNFPAKVVPIDLSQTGKMITKSGAYMAAKGDVNISVDFDCNCCTCCCGGMGLTRQSAEGNGTVFLAAGGTILTRKLEANETIVVDESSLVAFQDSVKMDIRAAGGCCTMCCGGEGMFVTTLKGPGLVIIQSMSFEKYRLALMPPTIGQELQGAV